VVRISHHVHAAPVRAEIKHHRVPVVRGPGGDTAEQFEVDSADQLAAPISRPTSCAKPVEAEHLCTQMRGVRDEQSKTVTTHLRRRSRAAQRVPATKRATAAPAGESMPQQPTQLTELSTMIASGTLSSCATDLSARPA
jgi:hypothetical protein